MATVNSSSSGGGGVIGSGCEVPRSTDRPSSVLGPSVVSPTSSPSERRDPKFAHNNSPSTVSGSGTDPVATSPFSNPTSDHHQAHPASSQDSASSNQQTLEEKLQRMNVAEFQALLEACSNKSKIKTQEHAAMFSQLEHPTKVSPEEQIPSLTNAKYSSSLQSLNQAQHPPSSSCSSRGNKGQGSTSYSSQNSTSKAGGSSGSWSSSGGPHATHNSNYHNTHSPHLSSKNSSSNTSVSNFTSTSQSCSTGDQQAQSTANSQSLHLSSNSVTLSLHNCHPRRDPQSASSSQADDSRCSGSSSSSAESPCSTTFTAQVPSSFHNHNTSPSSTSSSISSMSSVSSVNVNYNFNLKRPTPKPQIENHTEITATATLPSPYFFNIRNEDNDADGRVLIRNRVARTEHELYDQGGSSSQSFGEDASNLQLRNEYPAVNSLTHSEFSSSYGLSRYKDNRPTTPPGISEPATATLNITRTAPPRSGLDDRFERKKAARNNKNKKKETIIKPEDNPNYVGDKFKDIDQLVSFVDDSGEAAGTSSNAHNKVKNSKSRKARRREALSKSQSLDDNTLGLELNPGIETRSVSSTLVDKKSDLEEASSSSEKAGPSQSKNPDKGETSADLKSIGKSVQKPVETPDRSTSFSTPSTESKSEVVKPVPKETRTEPVKTKESEQEVSVNTHVTEESSVEKKVEAVVSKPPIRPIPEPDRNRLEITTNSKPVRIEPVPALGATPSADFITVTNRKKKVQKPLPPPQRSSSQGQSLGKPPIKSIIPQKSVSSASGSQQFAKGPSKPGQGSFPGPSRPPLQLQLSFPIPAKAQLNGATSIPTANKTERVLVDVKPAEQKVSTVTSASTPSSVSKSPIPHVPLVSPPEPVPVEPQSEVPAEPKPQISSATSEDVGEGDEEVSVETEDASEAVKFCGINFDRQPLPKADYEFGFGINEVLHDNPPTKVASNPVTPVFGPVVPLHSGADQSADSKQVSDLLVPASYHGQTAGSTPLQGSKQEHGERDGLLGRHPHSETNPSQPQQQQHHLQSNHPQQPVAHLHQLTHPHQNAQQVIPAYPMASSQFATYYPNYQQMGFHYYSNNGQPTPPPPAHMGMNHTPPPQQNQGHQMNMQQNHNPQLVAQHGYNFPPPNYQQVAAVLNSGVVPGHGHIPSQSHLYVQTSQPQQGGYIKAMPSPNMFPQPYQLAGVGQQFNAVFQQQQQQYMAALSSSGTVILPQMQYHQNPNTLTSPNQALIQNNPNPIPQTHPQSQLFSVPPPQQQQAQLFTSMAQPPQNQRRPVTIPSPSLPPQQMPQHFYPQVHCVQQPTLGLQMGNPGNFIVPAGAVIYKQAESPNDVNGNNSLMSDRDSTRGGVGGRGRRGRGGPGHMDTQGRGGQRPSNTNYRRTEPGSLPALMERSVHRHTGPFQQHRPEMFQRRDSKPSISPVTSPPMPGGGGQRYPLSVEEYNQYYSNIMMQNQGPPPMNVYEEQYRNRPPPAFLPSLDMTQQQYNQRGNRDRNATPKSSDSASEVSGTTPSPLTVSKETEQARGAKGTVSSPTHASEKSGKAGTGVEAKQGPHHSTSSPEFNAGNYHVVSVQQPLGLRYRPTSPNEQNDSEADKASEFMRKYEKVLESKIASGATVLRL